MALVDLRRYYASVSEQYFEMVDEIKDFEKEHKQGLISDSLMEQASQMIERLKQNYERLSYVMMLLNKPKRKRRVNSYNKQNKLELDYLKNAKATESDILEEDFNYLEKLRELVRKELN